ncbi:MAG: baseplate megatron protein TIM-barrel domain-containing protein, partial [Janthinobacterium lividum]
MTIHVFDLENQYFESRDSALLPIDNLTYNDDVTIDIWGAVGEKAVVDIKEAEIHEVVINKFEVQVPNTINFKFLTKKFTIKIKELIFKCGGIHYLGGATVENLSIFSYRPEVGINSDSVDNILIQTLPHDDEEPIRQMLSGIEMIPGCGEFVYDPKRSEAARSLSELKEALPNIKWVAPVVAWFANSLDIDKCQIKPGIDRNYEGLESWQVANYFQSSAHKISVDDKNCSVYGGTINDESIVKYLMLLKESELNIIFYPLIMVDIHGKPWRGRIGALSSDQDRIKNADYIEHFFQAQYRPFILHYANLVKDKIDAFIIGSELIGLTSIHDQNKKFLFVQKLVELASEVKQILGKNVKITYAADWSEYHSVPGGLRPLDDLWGSENIDFVGIDAYFPITDSKNSRIFTEAIKKGWHSGEGYDYYTSNGARIPFQSNEPWTQWKNLSYWWNSEHWAWDDEKKESIKTPWQPKSKQIWFTEFGFPSIDKAPNKPNIFYDPKSSEGNIPTYSSGRIDNAIQLRAIRASLEFWQGSEFLEQMILWTWDARGIGWQNDREYYADGDLWQYGHWLDSKIAYRHLEVGGDIKGVKNLIIKSKSLCLCVNLEVEDIFIEVENSIGISNKIHIGNNAFLKCNDLSINGDINGKALFIEALDTYVNYNIHSLELLCIKGKTLNIGQIDLRIAEIIINLTDCLIISNPSITSHRVENDDGGKTVTTIHNQSITRHTIEAIRAEFIVGGNFSIPPSIINIRELFIEAGELSLEAITTDHKMETVFTGKKDWKEDRQKWTEVKFAQTAHAVKLNADKLAIIVKNNFNAKASKITANELSMEAENYGFQGKNLDNYIIKDGHTKRGVFAPQKSFHGEHRHASIEGVKIVVSGQAYMIAHGQIWLRASGISAGQLAVEANKIILEGLVGSDYHSMSVTKKGTRLALTCNTKEISGGVEVYKECSRTQQYQEYLIPSILQGRESLQIEAGSLHQHGSILSGKSGKIKADSWTASAPTLTQSYSESIERISAGATIGIRQNISSAIEGLQNTGNAISNYDSNNNFAALNLASNMYSNFRALTNLAAGNVVNAGVWLSVSSSSSSTRSSIITHALSQADFEELEVTVSGRINGT